MVAEVLADSISLTWDAVPDVDVYRYEIFRGDVAGGPYSKIAEALAPTTGYTDTAVTSATTYYYIVIAVDTSFNSSANSDEVEASTLP
jgi:fibronectin type 3 domain-containing protein